MTAYKSRSDRPERPARAVDGSADADSPAHHGRAACPAHARPVALDDIELARRARTTLAASERGRLVIADGGPGGCGESIVPLLDDSGEVVVVVARDSPMPDAARRRRHAALLIDADPDYGVGVTLVGRLVESGRSTSPTGGESVASTPDLEASSGPSGQDQVAIRLTVERVLASCPHDRVSVLTRDRRPIPLELYALVEPDRLAVEIARLLPHLNDEHADVVRALAVHSSGEGAEQVVGARVSHLCRQGLRLWWVGRTGATEQTIRFPQSATSVEEIGRFLQF